MAASDVDDKRNVPLQFVFAYNDGDLAYVPNIGVVWSQPGPVAYTG